MAKNYAMEDPTEAERLEKQSQAPHFNHQEELASLRLPDSRITGRILDAGCGSGQVARHLAASYPTYEVIGCDFSEERCAHATRVSRGIPNIVFQPADVTRLPFDDASFDLIVCRYVLEHLEVAGVRAAVREMRRCLAPGGRVLLIDVDGCYHNLFPQPPLVAELLERMARSGQVDLFIGRKLPHYLHEAGFEGVEWSARAFSLTGELLRAEIALMTERMRNNTMFFRKLLDDDEVRTEIFKREYLEAMAAPGSAAFFNKFLVSAVAR